MIDELDRLEADVRKYYSTDADPIVSPQRVLSLISQTRELIEALERISAATPGNTNSQTAREAFSWTGAVAATALDRIKDNEND